MSSYFLLLFGFFVTMFKIQLVTKTCLLQKKYVFSLHVCFHLIQSLRNDLRICAVLSDFVCLRLRCFLWNKKLMLNVLLCCWMFCCIVEWSSWKLRILFNFCGLFEFFLKIPKNSANQPQKLKICKPQGVKNVSGCFVIVFHCLSTIQNVQHCNKFHFFTSVSIPLDSWKHAFAVVYKKQFFILLAVWVETRERLSDWSVFILFFCVFSFNLVELWTVSFFAALYGVITLYEII